MSAKKIFWNVVKEKDKNFGSISNKKEKLQNHGLWEGNIPGSPVKITCLFRFYIESKNRCFFLLIKDVVFFGEKEKRNRRKK